ncbi:hypothetical protein Nepgr_016789 [Nepenthes gracilis]|uniref:H(+)-exporting diphosphatase n=1 Tax=Nepenthes gracilis TaxID=150966 RepID=A0AAD3SP71_NEPGR|nr:hypothetical protein Nepgr_016789 [Nepenthes gracilis]
MKLQVDDDIDLTEKDAIFNYWRKYLPTQQIDDMNLISGMEQTSFLFQQASEVGFSHSKLLRSIIQHSCVQFPSLASYVEESHFLLGKSRYSQIEESLVLDKGAHKAFVIFGGNTSERQVSVMSGTNVWLNLKAFNDLEVIPCLLAPTYSSYTQKGSKEVVVSSGSVWSLPKQAKDELTVGLQRYNWFTRFDIPDEQPVRYSLGKWVKLAKEVQGTVFIAIQGGIGEDGTLRSFLEAEGIPYTEPGVVASSICMDKVTTSPALKHLADSRVLAINKEVHQKEDLISMPISESWHELTSKLQCELCVLSLLEMDALVGLQVATHSALCKDVADSRQIGAATNIIFGLALGYQSVIIPIFVIAISIYISFTFASTYDVAVATLGILSTIATGLAIDTYGPISGNAGGIAVMIGMSHRFRKRSIVVMIGMNHRIRERTDALDAAENTTSAIGKGFAINSIAFMSFVLFGAFVSRASISPADVLSPQVFITLIMGVMTGQVYIAAGCILSPLSSRMMKISRTFAVYSSSYVRVHYAFKDQPESYSFNGLRREGDDLEH